MSWFKHILVLFVWLAASWPCSHAVADEHHDHAERTVMCAMDGHQCHCHACHEIPCTDKTVQLTHRFSSGDSVWIPPTRTLYYISYNYSLCSPMPSTVPGSLNWLRTVQLLI